jgi:aspartyl-tRNA(Asn)/glutamyl-tRNA(Gln) amidotransferase subunit C
MDLAVSDIRRIARLARIAMTEEECAAALGELRGIFALIEQMQAVNTKDIEPMSHAQDVVLRLREDKVTETDQHDRFQTVAPQVEAGLYLVPKVIE